MILVTGATGNAGREVVNLRGSSEGQGEEKLNSLLV